jgi:hypothetical protein
MAHVESRLADTLTALEQLGRPVVVFSTDHADGQDALPPHVDVLQVGQSQDISTVVQRCNVEALRPTVVRINWRHSPLPERFKLIRRLERLGYTVEALRHEVIGLLPVPAPQAVSNDIVLYVITYNAPGQLSLWLDSVEAAAPELLQLPRKFLLDNSTDATTSAAYDALCAPYGFTILRHGNLGISGGRHFCARHFDELPDTFGMVWFEDDMQLAPKDIPVCRNGLSTQVPRLLDRARAIVEKERLDYLKLSFTEFFGDHHLNWAWYNVEADTRHREFPDGTFRTRIEYTGVEDGLSYAVGEFHYSNWPVLMTRRGNREIFLTDSEPLHEQRYMARAFTMMRAGDLRGGALLASPIWHDRCFHYTAEERREF